MSAVDLLLEYPTANDYYIFLLEENNNFLSDLLKEYQTLKDAKYENRRLSEEIRTNISTPLKIFKFLNSVGRSFLYKALQRGFIFYGYDEEKDTMQFEKNNRWYTYKEVREITKGHRSK